MQKECRQCSSAFQIEPEDLQFYDKISPVLAGKKILMPPLTLCPVCRRQRMLAWRNERTLYNRPCDLCKKNIVSVHSPENIYPVYCNPCWRSETWDPLSYGKDYDPSRPFLDQYAELLSRVPQRAMNNDNGVTSENSEYCQDIVYSRNCYLVFGTWKIEDCMYCRICDHSKFCVDCEDVKNGSELVYESVDSQGLYRCDFMQNSEQCSDCAFGLDLKGCTDCIACCNVRQKKYHIFNQPYSREEYLEKRAALQIDTRSGREKLQQEFTEWIRQFPRRATNLQNCEDCVGDHLFNCRDVVGFVNANAEHCRYVERSDGPIWSHDIIQSGGPQWCYGCITVDEGYLAHFALWSTYSHNALYCDNCISCDGILGCVSLRKKKYCILNREYSQEEYERLAAAILEKMREEGTYGEFFPIAMSEFGYNETNAQEFYPLTKEEVLAKGWKWRDNLPYTTGKETLTADQLPDSIHDVNETICNQILACATCKRNYKIISQELEFYKKLELPIPLKCPNCRNLNRLARRNPLALWDRNCGKCGKGIKTSYNPERPEIVYCEECYLATVY